MSGAEFMLQIVTWAGGKYPALTSLGTVIVTFRSGSGCPCERSGVAGRDVNPAYGPEGERAGA